MSPSFGRARGSNIGGEIADEIREVFLSSTVTDMETYRTGVQEALQHADKRVFLHEEWNEPAADVVDMCVDRINNRCDAYMGVFGYRYGWIPSGFDKSITHLEYECACGRWGGDVYPPLFVFLPHPESDAADELAKLAEEVLRSDYSDEPARHQESKDRQRAFRDDVRSCGRFVASFSDRGELRDRSIAAIYNWEKRILKRAREGRRMPFPQIPAEELGEIGRGTQLEVLDDALLALGRRTDAPGMCMVVHGPAEAGQRAFAAHLAAWDGWETSANAIVGSPSHDSFDTESLAGWVYSVVARTQPGSPNDFEALAAVILDHCGDEPVVLILDNLERLQGGLESFHRSFWLPLQRALRDSWRLKNRPNVKLKANRFTMIAISRRILPEPLPPFILRADPAGNDVDYDRLIPLPALGELTAGDVQRWLQELGRRGLARIPRARRARIADYATADGIPAHVFGRLEEEGFWGELAGGGG